LRPAVDELMDIVKVVLASAATAETSSSSVVLVHTLFPSVVFADSKEKAATVGLKPRSEVGCASLDVVVGVATAGSGSILALVLGDLHDALFATLTNRARVARRLLHREGRNQDGWNVVLISVFVEDAKIFLAGPERVVTLVQSVLEGNCHNVADCDFRGIPATAFDAAVDPVDTSIGTSELRRRRNCAVVATRTAIDFDGAAGMAGGNGATFGGRRTGGGDGGARRARRARRRTGASSRTRSRRRFGRLRRTFDWGLHLAALGGL